VGRAGHWPMFQYHTGPIKRIVDDTYRGVEIMFQYHTGPIKSAGAGGALEGGEVEFQYHTGPIKSMMHLP